MIFFLGVAFWFSLFIPAAMLDHAQNYLRFIKITVITVNV